MTTEERHDRDLGPALDTTDQLQPVYDALKQLGSSTDRFVERVESWLRAKEERRRTDRGKALVEMVDAAFQKLGRPTKVHGFHIEQSDEG